MFIKWSEKDFLMVSLYVGDLMYTSNGFVMINKFKEDMKSEFEMTDLGKMKYS